MRLQKGRGVQTYRLDEAKAKTRLAKDDITINKIRHDGIFFTNDILIQGKDARTLGSFGSAQFHPSGEIPNTFCPDCGSQGYRTDHPEVATCSYVPGWFFYYREEKEKEEEKEEKKTTLVRDINGNVTEQAVT